MIRVSPVHQIALSDALLPMIERPPERDYVIRRVSQKSVNAQPLIQGELVISGRETRAQHPMANEFPVHFRKTYYPICFHQNPAHEFDNQLAASRIIPVPPPIGSTRTTFRSCFIPGTPLSRLSPFGADPEERNIQVAADLGTAEAIGLWRLLEDVHSEVEALHRHGFAHGDLFLHNVIVSTTPIGTHLIDFEQAVQRTPDVDADAWGEIVRSDLREILLHAVCLQCGLGRQQGALAEASIAALPSLVQSAKPFLRAIERQSRDG